MHPNICVCEACAPVRNRTGVTILQHPTEVGHAKGTVRILTRCLANLRLFTGEMPGDFTWRKAAKILHQNPELSALPRFHFANPPASAYAIRKAPGEHRLATAEAVAYLLNVLEPELDTRPIAHAMRTLVDKQLAQIPARLHRHYQ